MSKRLSFFKRVLVFGLRSAGSDSRFLAASLLGMTKLGEQAITNSVAVLIGQRLGQIRFQLAIIGVNSSAKRSFGGIPLAQAL